MTRAAIYVRLSADRDSSSSPQTQLDGCLAYCRDQGWDVIEIDKGKQAVEDLGQSGSSRGKGLDRPGLLRIRARWDEIDKLVFLKADRISRDTRDILNLRAEAKEKGVDLVGAQDNFDFSTPAGQMFAEMTWSMSKMEAGLIRDRIMASQITRKKMGRYTGGTPLYGYKTAPNPDGAGSILVPDPDKAAVVVEAAEAVLSGKSRYQVAKEMSAKGLTTVAGKPWTGLSLTRLLTSEGLLGRVLHKKQLMTDEETGMPIQFWEPILTLDTFQSLQVALAPKRKRERKPNARLLSGLLFCALCKGPLYVSGNSAHFISYSCPGRSSSRNCPGVSISCQKIETYIQELFLKQRGKYEIYKRTEAPRIQTELAEIQRQKSRLFDLLPDRTQDRTALFEKIDVLEKREDELKALPMEEKIELVSTGVTFKDAFEAAESDAARRNIISKGIKRVIVQKGVRGSTAPLSEDRVQITWSKIIVDFAAELKDINRTIVPFKGLEIGRGKLIINGQEVKY